MDSPMIVIEEWKIEGRKGRWRLIKNEQEDLYFFLFFTMAPISSCNRRITDRGGSRRLQKFIYNVQLNRVRTIQLGEHLIARRWPPATYLGFPIVRPATLVGSLKLDVIALCPTIRRNDLLVSETRIAEI